jgi:propionyl-CoA carboxylase alpha chain
VRAIDEYRISGVTTTMEFCKYAVQHEAFRSGNFDTHFVKEHWNPEAFEQQSDPAIEKVAAIFGTRAAIENRRKSTVTAENDNPSVSKWKTNRLRK